jgi:hypothetical protein
VLRAQTHDDLSGALTSLTSARYGRVDTYDRGVLDDALESVIRAADRVARQHTWIAEGRRAVADAFRGRTSRAWAR